jgi:zinc protease
VIPFINASRILGAKPIVRAPFQAILRLDCEGDRKESEAIFGTLSGMQLCSPLEGETMMDRMKDLVSVAGRWSAMAAWMAILAPITQPLAAFDLAEAQRFQLDNGLTLIVLEVPDVPVVSVQMLYRVGARNEEVGRTGLTHFLEHMAFRASENFPDTELVSSIYAVGGEWHGYTWLDQTTYFETLPAEHLDLALRIEADRMARLLIPAAEVEAERGAVLTEMHGYDNDPASVLHDAVMAVSFLQHPYRNNTIGWESDVESITHDDLVEIYRRSYRPANAVLAVVGRISAEEVLERVRELFGALPGGARTLPPPTVEPPQTGVRRIELRGPGSRKRFMIAFRAPSVTSPDYPAFLLAQQVLAGGRGINFAQDEFGDAVLPTSRLAGITEDLVSWYPPQAAPYVFTIAGSIDAEAATTELEGRIQEAIGTLVSSPPSGRELTTARQQLLDELVYDVETTEDAAHQLAYFAGLEAHDVLFELPRRLASVTAADISRVAGAYLRPHQRTIGWYLAVQEPVAPPSPGAEASAAEDRAPPASERAPQTAPAARSTAPSPPRVVRLADGVPVIFQSNPLSSAAFLRVLLSSAELEIEGAATPNSPVWRHTSLNFRFRPEALEATLAQAWDALGMTTYAPPPSAASIEDPAARLAVAFDEVLGVSAPESAGISAIALVGDLRIEGVLPKLEEAFGDLTPTSSDPLQPRSVPRNLEIELPVAKAQAQLGYIVAAPPPTDPDWFAWRMLLYVLSHGYEGRLGVEAISRRGLVYYIDAQYLNDGTSGRVSLAIGVDPAKLNSMRDLLDETLQRLAKSPPTEVELAEAKSHLLGRRLTAAQSNEEVSAALIEEWVGQGRLLSGDEFAAAVNAVSQQDVERILPAFLAGTTVIVKGAE